MDILQGAGVHSKPPVKNEFDQLDLLQNVTRIKHFQSQSVPAFIVLDMMDAWRNKCTEKLLLGDVLSIDTAIGLIRVLGMTVNGDCAFNLTLEGKCPLSKDVLSRLIRCVLSIKVEKDVNISAEEYAQILVFIYV